MSAEQSPFPRIDPRPPVPQPGESGYVHPDFDTRGWGVPDARALDPLDPYNDDVAVPPPLFVPEAPEEPRVAMHSPRPEVQSNPVSPASPQLPPLKETLLKPLKTLKSKALSVHGALWDLPTYGLADFAKRSAGKGATHAGKGANKVYGAWKSRTGKNAPTPAELASRRQSAEESERFWEMVESPAVAIPGVDSRYDPKSKEGINVSKNPHADRIVAERPSSVVDIDWSRFFESSGFSEADKLLLSRPHDIWRADREIADKWEDLDPQARVNIVLRSASLFQAIHETPEEDWIKLAEARDSLLNYLDSIKADPDLMQYRTRRRVPVEDDIREPENWDKLDSNLQEAILSADVKIEQIKLDNPNGYLESEEYRRAYRAHENTIDVARAELVRIDPDHIYTTELSRKQQVVGELTYIQRELSDLFLATDSPLYALLYEQREKILQNNLDLFAGTEESPYDGSWFGEIIDGEKEDFDAKKVQPDLEVEEKRKLSKGAKVALGVGAVAAVAAVGYVGYRHLPEESKDKLKGAAANGVKKAKDVTTSGREKLGDTATKAKEAVASKKPGVESLKPNVEAKVRNTKEAAGSLYKRAKSSSTTARAKSGAVKAAAAVKAKAAARRNK